MSIRYWTKEEDKVIIEKYPKLGTKIKDFLFNRDIGSIIRRASRLKIKKIITKKESYCKKCGKELKTFHKEKNKYYASVTKTNLCKNCSAKKIYSNRGAFTHKKGKLWTNDEIELLKKEYPDNLNPFLAKLFNRNESSIIHKANRLGIHKSKKFWNENPTVINKLWTSKNNPSHNLVLRKKMSDKMKEGYKEGRIKLSGIALKSSLGLTKKENHPNWLGGISFEPYDSKFDESFCELIRQRDKVCLICNKTNEEELKSGQSLCVHHLDYNKKNTCKENCLSLCNSCHCKTNYNRSSWIKFFQTLMSDRYGYNYENNTN